MIDSEKPQFVKIILGFAELKGKTLSAPAFELYWLAMRRDWSLAEFQAAAVHLLKSGRVWSGAIPQPADFEALRQSGRPTAAEAWVRVLDHASSGAGRRGGLGDELLDECVRVFGGYRAIADSDVKTIPFLERRFCEHYQAMREARDVREDIPQIAKWHPPKLLGDVVAPKLPAKIP